MSKTTIGSPNGDDIEFRKKTSDFNAEFMVTDVDNYNGGYLLIYDQRVIGSFNPEMYSKKQITIGSVTTTEAFEEVSVTLSNKEVEKLEESLEKMISGEELPVEILDN